MSIQRQLAQAIKVHKSMSTKPKKGLLISIEGDEATGKTTQVRKLLEWLATAGIDAVSSKEPGTVWDGAIRKIVLAEQKPTPIAELFLFLADRAQHVSQIVVPALKEGKWVVLDRYCDSTVVYQGYCRGVLPVDEIIKLNWVSAMHQAAPNLTIILDAPEEVSGQRLAERDDKQTRIAESEGLEFKQEVRQGFLRVAEANPKRVVVVNAEGTVDEVFERIIKVIRERLL